MERGKAYRKAHPEKAEKYYQANRIMINAQRRVVRTGACFTLNNRMSSSIRKSLIGNKNGHHWEDLVGYTLGELIGHLERQFAPGMSWANRGEWHIDHILPISAFSFTTPEDPDFKRCWALDNLQPLWASDNIRKSDNISPEYQPSLFIP